MATLHLGRIKPVFKGAYNNATAYVVDDIVTSGNETFICILASTGNATSNATYWTKLAAKGTEGTDVGTTLTTQGDILYRDSSGLQRLAAGTNGQALLTGGAGANPSWGDASGIISSQQKTSNSRSTISSGSFTNVFGTAMDIGLATGHWVVGTCWALDGHRIGRWALGSGPSAGSVLSPFLLPISFLGFSPSPPICCLSLFCVQLAIGVLLHRARSLALDSHVRGIPVPRLMRSSWAVAPGSLCTGSLVAKFG